MQRWLHGPGTHNSTGKTGENADPGDRIKQFDMGLELLFQAQGRCGGDRCCIHDKKKIGAGLFEFGNVRDTWPVSGRG